MRVMTEIPLPFPSNLSVIVKTTVFAALETTPALTEASNSYEIPSPFTLVRLAMSRN